jgi:restriction system protein
LESYDEETVLLDELSGFDFEKVIGRILERLQIGKVQQVLFTQDEGRDILVQSPQGLIVVECKHQPNTSIGRPIVQKLHSAVISSKATKGILVTTGRFTEEAIEHSRKLQAQGTAIDMVDRRVLADMAARARIRLISRGEALGVWTYSIPSESDSKAMLGSFLHSQVDSYPRSPIELLGDWNRSIAYRPIYAVKYEIDATFSTSVGVVHRERSANQVVMFDGNTGQLTRDDVVKFFIRESQTRFAGTHTDFKGELPTFKVDSMSLQRVAKTTIAKLHTRTVPYMGKNNVTYRKVCEPSEQSISIDDIRQLYLPTASIGFKLGNQQYQVGGVQGLSGRFLPVLHDVLKCRTCYQPIHGRGLLCDTCGRVTHSGGLRLKTIHGFRCGNCGRTTCRSDGNRRSRYLVWRQLLCPQCNEEMRTAGKATKKLE